MPKGLLEVVSHEQDHCTSSSAFVAGGGSLAGTLTAPWRHAGRQFLPQAVTANAAMADGLLPGLRGSATGRASSFGDFLSQDGEHPAGASMSRRGWDMEFLPHPEMPSGPLSAGAGAEPAVDDAAEAQVPVIPSLPIVRKITAKFADAGEAETEVVEYWAVEGSDGKVHHGHRVHYIHQSPLAHKAHDDQVKGSDDGSRSHAPVHARPKDGSGHEAAVQDEEPGPSDGAPGRPDAPVASVNVDDSRDEQSALTPSVLFGGTVATVIQVYLWATVFVTLFKAHPRTPQPVDAEPQPEVADAGAAVSPPAPAGAEAAPEVVQPEAPAAPPSFTGRGSSGNLGGSMPGRGDG